MENLFHAYWWLLFPVLGMAMGFYAIHSDFKHKRDLLGLVKSYVDQGKEPPQSLLDKLDKGVTKTSKSNEQDGGLATALTFIALAAAFAFFGLSQNEQIFIALAIGFGIGGVGALLGTLYKNSKPKI